MQKIGIGYENYKRIIDDGCYYVDKTLLIRDVVKRGGMVTLFTRPRRFGKTLALSMLRTFFEKEYDYHGNLVDNSRYFAEKKIMEAEPEILSMMGRFPVIKLSLQSAKQPDFRRAFKMLRDEIIAEFRRHAYIWKSEGLSFEEREGAASLAMGADDQEIRDESRFKEEVGRYAAALKTLSICLEKFHEEKVIILLDEYDVPLENAYYNGFYREMVDFIHSLFESAMKTNDALEFAVVTGCLRISKESIFTGLNHLQINSIRSDSFSEGFGFTPEETGDMLAAYGIEENREEVRDWYNGYLFGQKEIYNPWSVISYVFAIVIDRKQFPEPYWANTSSNQIIRDMIWQADEGMREELDELVSGGTIEKQIHEDITYDDIHESEDNLWNFLFFTGYMKKVSERQVGKNVYLTMRIPNMEIASIYENQISKWFDKVVKDTDRSVLHKAVLEGDGRPDIVLYPKCPSNPAIIFEIKVRKKFNEMQDGLDEACRQIRDKRYEEGILEDGYIGVKSYGICFCRKSCIVGKDGSVM